VGDKLFVTFASLKDLGGGVVDVFDMDGGNMVRVAANYAGTGPHQGPLQNPWGITQAPAKFGAYSAALALQDDTRPVGHQPVAQEDVPGAEHVPQPAEQADLALPLAGILAEPEVHDRPAHQRDHRPNPRDREAKSRLLVVDLRGGFLVLRCVRHRDRRAV
jgi:hypothetical protein